jgi:hypothetical protein
MTLDGHDEVFARWGISSILKLRDIGGSCIMYALPPIWTGDDWLVSITKGYIHIEVVEPIS